MRYLANIADRVLGRPLLVHPGKAEIIAGFLGENIGVVGVITQDIPPEEMQMLRRLRSDSPTVQANRLVGDPGGTYTATGRLAEWLYNVQGGTAIIPITGTLVNRGAYVGEDGSGFQSYEGLAYQINAALGDNNVQSILLDFDSPGGEATGMWALAENIRLGRQVKPITSMISDMAASAAYGLAANSTNIVVSPTSVTGSIGVVMMHVDRSEEMKKLGRNVSFIYAGKNKVDGNQFGPLSADVRADLQRDVNTFYDRFVETVAAGRPSLTTDDIRKTEARTFIGSDAINMGLADSVGTFAETIDRLSAINRARAQGSITMATEPVNPIASPATDVSEAVRAESARIQGILTCENANGRETLARHFAFNTTLSIDQASAALAAAPSAAPARAVPSLAERQGVILSNFEPKSQTENVTAKWDRVMAKAMRNIPSS
jgi:capsid assembly protease